MTDHLAQLLQSAADDRQARVVLAPPSAVLRQGRLRRRRRAVPVVLLAGAAAVALAAVAPALDTRPDREAQTVLDAADSTTGPDRTPTEAALRAALAAATPPLVPGELRRVPADDPAAIGLWAAPGRTPLGDALYVQTADERIGADWQLLSVPVTGDEVDRVARASLTGPSVDESTLTVLDTGVPQVGRTVSRAYATPGGLAIVYAWSAGGAVVTVRGGGGSGRPDPAEAAPMERLARSIIG